MRTAVVWIAALTTTPALAILAANRHEHLGPYGPWEWTAIAVLATNTAAIWWAATKE